MLITDSDHVDLAADLCASLGVTIISVDQIKAPHREFWGLVDGARDTVDTADTTGPAKGVLHGHRVLLGHLPRFDLSHNLFGRRDDRLWTPADWAWIGGLLDGLIPTWFSGRPVVATRQAKFDPEWALRVIGSHHVRNVFLPPTALKLMREVGSSTSGVSLRSIMSGGEPLGEELLGWTRERLGVTINEIYGQTEANYLLGNCAEVWDVRPGSMGRPYPGHDVAILTAEGSPADLGQIGQIALRAPDPVVFLQYWGKPDLTQAKFTRDGTWLLTGDLAHADQDGYVWYTARADDVINSAGYRIGPTEIEECLLRHPAVAMAAAIGVPDPLRGEVVKAFLVLGQGQAPSAELEAEIKDWVKRRLAAYLYPRQLEFVSELPMTSTGKIRRSALRESARRRQADQPRLDDTVD